MGFHQRTAGEAVLSRQQKLSAAELATARVSALREIIQSTLTTMDLYLASDQPFMLPGFLSHSRLAETELRAIAESENSVAQRTAILRMNDLLNRLQNGVRSISSDEQALSADQLSGFDDMSAELVENFELLEAETLRRQALLGIQHSAATNNESNSYWLYMVAFFVAVLLLLSWLLRRISKPLVALSRNASRSIEEQQPFHPTVRGAHEIVQLSGTLGRVINSLEQLVEERTSQLAKETNRLEQEIKRRADAELQLIEARDSAEEANRAKSAFLAMMSHEIRTPMNSIIGFSELLKATPLQSEQADFTSHIHDSAEALLSLLNDVLDFSKIEAGRLNIEEEEFDLVECIEKAMDVVMPSAAEKNVEVILEEYGDLPRTFLGDKSRIRQVLVNLLGNAVKFTDYGRVELTVGVGEKTAEHGRLTVDFTVKDSGIGIASEHQDRLFRPFSQGDSSTSRRYGGTGLGLAICRRLVELMGGTIDVQSELGGGSTFRFSLMLGATPPLNLNCLERPQVCGPVVVLTTQSQTAHALHRKLTKLGIQATVSTSWSDPPVRSLKNSRNWLLIVDTHFAALADRGIPTWPQASRDSGNVLVMAPLGSKPVLKSLSAQHLVQPVSQRRLLDVLRSADAAESAPPVVSMPEPEGRRVGQQLRILLAEDNDTNRKLALLNLQRLGYSADVVENGRLAVDAIRETQYDVLLTDIQMPELDGLNATREIRRLERMGLVKQRAPLRIIAMTANAMIGDREKYLAAGMDDYVSKPLRLSALKKALAFVAEPTQSAVENTGGATTPDDPESALREWCSELDPEMVISMARDFLGDADKMIADGIDSCRRDPIEDLNRKAHSLKGTFNIFGLTTLAGLSSNIEDRTHDLDDSELVRSQSLEVMETIKQQFEECRGTLLEAIETLVAELPENCQV